MGAEHVPADMAGVEGAYNAAVPRGAVPAGSSQYQSQHGRGIPVGHYSGVEYVAEKRACSGSRKADGAACGAYAMPGESYCKGHLPKGE